MSVWYIRDAATPVGWSSVTAWSTGATIAAGVLRRQSATPAVGSERVFIAIVAGTTHATTEPTWTTTKGAKTTDNTVTWQECTGNPGVNGDLTNTPLSSSVRSVAQALGKIIQNNAGTRIFICSTAGTPGGSEPSYNTAAVGNTTTDGTATWTYIGASFSTWSAPFARLQLPTSFSGGFGANGDTFYIADDHSETQAAAISYTLLGSTAAPINIICVDHTASLPPGSSAIRSDPYTASSPACAQVTTTGANAQTYSAGNGHIYGVVFNCGTGAVSSAINAAGFTRMERCSLRKLGTTGTTSAIALPAGDFLDSTVQFGSSSDSMQVGNSALKSRWLKSSSGGVIGATLPTTLFRTSAVGMVVVEGVDLSALGSGKTIFPAASIDYLGSLINCKLGSSVTVAATPTSRAASFDVIASDSAATIYRQERYRYEGTLTNETTIVRTGGASDGATTLAWKIVTTANSTWSLPFECFPISIWNSITGSSRTLTLYGIWGGGAVPNNDDIWIDVEYLGDSGSPLGSFVTSNKANFLASNSALSSDSSTWGGSTTKFKMSALFTPELQGYVRVYVRAAAASSTFYVDPKPVLS